MWYSSVHANTIIYSTAHGDRTGPTQREPPLGRGLDGSPLPNIAGQCRGPTYHGYCLYLALPRSNGPQCYARVQPPGPGGAPAPIASSSPAQGCFRYRTTGAPARLIAPEPPHLWQAHQSVDAPVGRRGQLRARDDAPPSQWRGDSPRPQAPGGALEARQTLDHEPRSGLCSKKNSATG